MTNLQKLESLLNLARQAPAPAEIHERILAMAKELAAPLAELDAKAISLPPDKSDD